MAKQKYDLKTFKEDVAGQMPILKQIAPPGFNEEKFKRNLISAVSDNPKILNCTKKSLFLAVNKSAQLGFEPGFMGYCYLVPFGEECTFMLGYRGILELVRRSGQLRKISAHVVYDNDHFKIDLGEEKVDHVPFLEGPRGNFKLVWCRAELEDGSIQIEFMTKDQVDKIRNGSKQKNGIPWSYHYDEMARKTIIRRISKMLPMMVDDYRLIQTEAKEESRDVDASVLPPDMTDDPLSQGSHGSKKAPPAKTPPANKANEKAPENKADEPPVQVEATEEAETETMFTGE